MREKWGAVDLTPTFGEAGWDFLHDLSGLIEDQVAAIERLRQDLAQEQQVNALLLAWFEAFRATVCKAAWTLSWPGADWGQVTSIDKQGTSTRHYHESFGPDARDALAALAALDDSGYAPRPENAGKLVEGTGVGDVAPRYEDRTVVADDHEWHEIKSMHSDCPICNRSLEP